MEDKLKDVFDNMNEEETDVLLKDIDVDKSSLNEKNVRKMVFDKLKLEESPEPKIRRFHFNWKVYSIVATAACFALIIGTVIIPFATKKEPVTGNPVDIAEAESNEDDDLSGSYDNSEDGGIYNKSEDGSEETDSVDKNNPDKEKGKNNNKSNKDDKKENNKDKSHVAIGENQDDLGLLLSDEVDILLEDSANDIDMDKFGVEFSSLNDMVDNSDYIIRGHKTSSSLVSSDGADVYDLYAGFEVSSVINDNVGQDIKSSIKIKEGIKYNSETECYTHVGGYTFMKTDKEYILFVNKVSKNKYELSGLLCGKVPIDVEEQELCLDSDFIGNEDVNIIKGIIDEARKTYIGYEKPAVETYAPAKTQLTPSPTSQSSLSTDSSDEECGNTESITGKSNSMPSDLGSAIQSK